MLRSGPTTVSKRTLRLSSYGICIVVAAAINGVFAQDAPDLLQIYTTALSTFQVPYCCGSTLKECAEKKPECSIAGHLKKFTFWMVDHDPPPTPEKIQEELAARYRGMTTTKTFPIDTANLPRYGNPEAPVTIIAYVSATCPLCKRVIGDLYDSLKFGSLKNKAQLMVKPFGTNMGNTALCASQADGNFWKLFKALRARKALIKESSEALAFADSIGIGTEQFKKRLKDPRLQQWLIAVKKEGKDNGIKYLPTFFINGKRYESYKDPEWVVDAILYELDK